MSVRRPRALQALSIVLLAAMTVVCLGDLVHAGMPGGAGARHCSPDIRCGDETLCSAATPSSSTPVPVAVLWTIPGPAAPTITTAHPVALSPPAPGLPPLLAVASRSPPLA